MLASTDQNDWYKHFNLKHYIPKEYRTSLKYDLGHETKLHSYTHLMMLMCLSVRFLCLDVQRQDIPMNS